MKLSLQIPTAVTTLCLVATASAAELAPPPAGPLPSPAQIQIDSVVRSPVPQRIETAQQQLPDGRTRAETVTLTRLANGSYAVSARAVTTTQPAGEGETRSVTEVVESTLQSSGQTTQQILTTTTQRGASETTRISVGWLSTNGKLVPSRQVDETVTRQADGALAIHREVREPDVNGSLRLLQKVEQTTTSRDAATVVTQASVFSTDRLTGRFAETARETTVVRQAEGRTQTERTISAPAAAGWVVESRIVTTQTPAGEGGVQRETVRYGKADYAGRSTASTAPLEPRLKIIERQVATANGGSVTEQEVFTRDVNNRWQPVTTSSVTGK